MKILVCVTQVAEVSAYVEFTADGTAVDAAFTTASLNEADQNAVEEALTLAASAGGGEVVLASFGNQAEEALRAGLTMGADRALRIAGDGLEVSDTRTVAAAIAQALATEQPDLVLTGVQASDTGAQSMGPALAAAWGTPWVSVARSLGLEGRTLSATREFEAGISESVSVELPAVVSVQVGANQPRYGSFKDKMRAKKADLPVFTPTDLPPPRVVLTGMSVAQGGGRDVAMVEGGPAEVAARIVAIVREAR